MKSLLVLLAALCVTVQAFLVEQRSGVASHPWQNKPKPSLVATFLANIPTAGKDARYTIPLEQISLTDLPKVGG
jgi:hypothetical protein